ncbi:unnamed protein product [Heterobilharzia americana]|nr:unnamed protein product [Heterobilharzia americana]
MSTSNHFVHSSSVCSKPSRPDETKKKENPKDKKSGVKNTKLPEPPVDKEKSKLYKRGEEIPEDKYLGDEPANGICRYILLVNFEKLGLLEELCHLQIDVHSIIRLHVNDQKQLQILITKQKAEKMWGSKGSEQDLEQMRSEQEAIISAEEHLRQYWRTTSILMRDHVYDRLGNIATLDYNVKTELLPDDLNGTENRASFGVVMFNEIATILYDLIDFRRQWQNYLQHIKVIQLPMCPPLLDENYLSSQSQLTKLLKPIRNSMQAIADKSLLKAEECGDNSTEDFLDMKFYNEVLQGLPIENTSVELILHAVIEQVYAIEKGILPKNVSIDEKARNEGIDPHIARNIANEVDKLVLTEVERTKLSEEISLHEKSTKSPLNTSPSVILHPYDENQYKQLLNANKVDNCEALMKSEMDLFAQSLPNIFSHEVEGKNERAVTSELQSEFKEDQVKEMEVFEENITQMKEVRFNQILQFAEKFGFTAEEFKHYFSKLQLETLKVWKLYSSKKKFQQSLKVIQPLGSSCGTLVENSISVSLNGNGKKSNNQMMLEAIPLDDPYLLYGSLSTLFAKIEFEINRLLKLSLEANNSKNQQNSSSTSLSIQSTSPTLFAKKRSQSLSSASSSTNRRSPASSRLSNSTRTSEKDNETHTSHTSIETVTRSKSTRGRRSSSAVRFDLSCTDNKRTNLENKDQKNEYNKLTILAQELQEIIKQLKSTNQIMMTSDKGKQKLSSNGSYETCTVVSESFRASLEKVRNIHLDEWSVEEKLKPHTLLQRLHSLNYERPYLDVYKRRYDESLFIVCHHPFDRSIRSNHITWSSWFHVNKIGFRPYLQLIESHIRNWTREQEAIYEAAKLSSEILQADDNGKTSTEVTQSKQSKKSPKSQKAVKSKRTRSASGSESDTSTIQGETKSLLGDPNEFILPGSLKALQREQEVIRLKKEAEERQKEEKRAKSAKKQAEKESMHNQKKESPGRHGKSPRSKSPMEKKDPDNNINNLLQLKIGENSPEFWPFVGYDVSNLLPHLTGEVTHMFPTDGGTIKTQRSEIPTGEANLRVSLIKDGHVFTIHKNDGPPEPNIPYENPNEIDFGNRENENGAVDLGSTGIIQEGCDNHDSFKNPSLPELFSSVTACFSDGICLAVSRINNLSLQSTPHSEREPNQFSFPHRNNKTNDNNSNTITNNNDNNKEVNLMHIEGGEGAQVTPFKQFIHLSTPDGAQVSIYHQISQLSNPLLMTV